MFLCTTMKLLLTILTTIQLAGIAVAGTCDIRLGTIEVPEDFVFTHTGTKDSFMGTLARKSDGFTIHFDVGGMAGVHMHEGKQALCTYFRKTRIGELPAVTGIEPVAKGQRITISIGDAVKAHQSPANFWADITQPSDIAEFVLIVTSYRLKPHEP